MDVLYTDLQQKEEIVSLSVEVRQLKESVMEGVQNAKNTSRQQLRIPSALSVSSRCMYHAIVLLSLKLLQVAVRKIHDNAPENVQFDGSVR